MGEYGEVDSFMCEWCDVPFTRPSTMGPPPKFCSASHRQRAYELRRLEKIAAERDRLRVVVERALNLGEDEGMRRGKTPYPDWWVLLDHALDPRHRPDGSAEAKAIKTRLADLDAQAIADLRARTEQAEAERDRLRAAVMNWLNAVVCADGSAQAALNHLGAVVGWQLDGSTEATDG